jgi:hypothetical protein
MWNELPSARCTTLIGVCAATALLCTGCDAIPGTSAYREARAKQAIAEQLIDPTAAQFRKMRIQGSSVCGEVNGKNKMGAYVGYSRFVVDTSTYEALIDPEFDYTDLFTARDLCTQMTANEYSSVAGTISACKHASDLEATRANQEAFNRRWVASCAGEVVRRIYQPPLSQNVSVAPSSNEEDLSAAVFDDNISAAEDNLTVGQDETGNDANVENSVVVEDPDANSGGDVGGEVD